MTGVGTKLAKHYRWAREQGVRRLIEEDQLDPVARARTAMSKAAWRREHAVPAGTATAVLVVGLQRSGTNMLMRGLEAAPEVEVHNENDGRLFDRFVLRSPELLRDTVARSRHRFVLVKPLCDSHRTPELLAAAGGDRARAIWAFRGVDGRVRSAVTKFGAANLRALQALAAGRAGGRWEAGGLTAADVELVRSLDVDALDPESGSALFWYLRNKLYFDLGLDRDPRVALASYEGFCAEPEATMRALCERIGFEYRPVLVAGVESGRSGGRPPLELDPRVRALCDDMTARLAAASAVMYGTV